MIEEKLQKFFKEKINVSLEIDDDIFKKTNLSSLKIFYYVLLFAKTENLKLNFKYNLESASISEIIKLFKF